MSINLSGASGSVVLRASGGGGGVGPTGPTGPQGEPGATGATGTGTISAVNSAGYGPTSPHAVLSTTSSSYTTLADGISITATTGTSVLISLSSWINSSSGTGTRYVSVQVSGATTLAAADENSISSAAAVNAGNILGKTWVLTGLTAGSNTFTLRYKTEAGATGQFYYQRLVVQTLS